MKITFIEALEEQFEMHKDIFYAKKIEKLMKYAYPFIGIKGHLRLQILKYLYPDYKEEIESNLISIVQKLYAKEEREYHYIALELLKKNITLLYKVEYFIFLKDLLDTKANWDTTDIIAKDIVSKYLLYFPELKHAMINLLVNSGNTWKIRSAIIFQINYREKTNKNLLFIICDKFLDTNDNNIYNAIIWALKEYKKYNEVAVNQFLKDKNFSLVSKKVNTIDIDVLKKLIFEINTKKVVSI